MRRTSIIAIAAAALLLCSGSTPHVPALAQAASPSRGITVSADGKATVRPDVAFITVGVQQTDLQAGKAQDQANTITAQALARFKALGIPDRDIQTVDISLNPQYDNSGTLTGFTASDTLSITVEHIQQAGAVIDAGVAAGANHNVSVSFGLKDDSQARSAALRAAVAAAQQKAAAVAAQLGISLQGAKIQVVENSAQIPEPLAQSAQFGAAVRSSVAPTPVETGSLTVQDSVTLTYTL